MWAWGLGGWENLLAMVNVLSREMYPPFAIIQVSSVRAVHVSGGMLYFHIISEYKAKNGTSATHS